MTDLVLSTGERVPPLADTAVVHEDGPWKLLRVPDGHMLFSGRQTVGLMWIDGGKIRVWTFRNGIVTVYMDHHEALAALWAARGG